MRIAQHAERLVLVVDGGILDVDAASGGQFGPDPQAVFEHWDEFQAWASSVSGPTHPLDPQALGPPVPRPRQVFAIGMNYAAHAAEGGVDPPTFPPTFTKFPTCLTGPYVTVELPSGFVDWEVELVVVISRHSHHVAENDAWRHVAGLTVGQDLSDRPVQLRPPAPQFSLGKSFPGFGPTGPWLVTPDELDDPDDLPIGCTLNGQQMQKSRTSDLIFGVPTLIHQLSSITPLLPGDLIFTGTPSGVGGARTPPQFLTAGDELVSTIDGIGTITTHFTNAIPRNPTGEALKPVLREQFPLDAPE
jgi:2-keto-4-pentenoate hydratase/2-oxohepta-3-ene-1,7-dioic acid hydratase in catechol pathway